MNIGILPKKRTGAQKGHIVLETTRQKLRVANLGKRQSKETCEKRNASLKGHLTSVTTRDKISKANKGRHLSEATRKNLSEKNKGKHCGENHPQWRGGISFEPYCPKFTKEFKERVRAFFNHICQLCGHVWQPGERKLAVHHINYQKDACCDQIVLPLFVSLCARDNTKVNTNREYWESYFTEMIHANDPTGKCYFTKEEMKGYGN